MAIQTDSNTEDAEDTRETTWQRFALNENTLRALLLTGFLVVIIAYFAARDPSFLSGENGLNILVNASVISIVALGLVLASISGGFDSGVSGTVPLGAVVFALLVNKGWGVLPAMLGV